MLSQAPHSKTTVLGCESHVFSYYSVNKVNNEIPYHLISLELLTICTGVVINVRPDLTLKPT